MSPGHFAPGGAAPASIRFTIQRERLSLLLAQWPPVEPAAYATGQRVAHVVDVTEIQRFWLENWRYFAAGQAIGRRADF
jgi:hypothetical protein